MIYSLSLKYMWAVPSCPHLSPVMLFGEFLGVQVCGQGKDEDYSYNNSKEILKSINGTTWPSSLTAICPSVGLLQWRWGYPEKLMRRIQNLRQQLPPPREHALRGGGWAMGKGRKHPKYSRSPRVQQMWFHKTASQGSQIDPAFCWHLCPSQIWSLPQWGDKCLLIW